jgi:hypothetical protein
MFEIEMLASITVVLKLFNLRTIFLYTYTHTHTERERGGDLQHIAKLKVLHCFYLLGLE